MQKETVRRVKYLMEHASELPFQTSIDGYTEYLTHKGMKVYWLMSRQKPSVEANYSFDMERLGIREDGQLLFGFDSGCSCPTPWEDEPYEVKTHKEFEVEADKVFDIDWEPETIKAIDYAYMEMKK